MKSRTLLLSAFLLACAVAWTPSQAAAEKDSIGVWWWNGPSVTNSTVCAERFAFLKKNGVTEIYFCTPFELSHKQIAAFVRQARGNGMRVAWLNGDASWIRPECKGFDEVFDRYLAYQKGAPADARFYAIHLDVEPHAIADMEDSERWRLYGDLVLRAAKRAHDAGEKIEWDIPFWLELKRMARDGKTPEPLLDAVIGCSDGVTLMSYRDTAEAVLGVSRQEIDLAKKGRCRVVCGTETGLSTENQCVSFFEEGAAHLRKSLKGILAGLRDEKLPGGAGVAVHHVGSWMELPEEPRKDFRK